MNKKHYAHECPRCGFRTREKEISEERFQERIKEMGGFEFNDKGEIGIIYRTCPEGC